MRLAFLGTPAFAVPALLALHAAGHDIICAYTQPPRPAGRGQSLTPSPVHAAATGLGIPVRTPARLKRDSQEHEAFAALDLDAAVVAAYGLILPQPMLDAPRQGCLNIHASLLPRWRGAAPIQAAILAGDAQSGITIMRMDAGLDTGAMLLRQATPITARTTAATLHDTLAELGASLILQALADPPAPEPQPEHGVTYAAKLTRGDARLDLTQPAEILDRRIRAFTPWPGTYALLAGAPLKILAATPFPNANTNPDANPDTNTEPAPVLGATPRLAPPGTILDAAFTIAVGHGALRLDRVQRAGRPATTGDAFLRGLPNPTSLILE